MTVKERAVPTTNSLNKLLPYTAKNVESLNAINHLSVTQMTLLDK